jgi:hypothetical protein
MHFGTSEQVTPLSLLESWTLSKPSGKQLFKLLAIFEKKMSSIIAIVQKKLMFDKVKCSFGILWGDCVSCLMYVHQLKSYVPDSGRIGQDTKVRG